MDHKLQSNLNSFPILLLMCLGIFICLLDTTIMNIALPAIQNDLNTTLETSSWMLNTYTMTIAVLSIRENARRQVRIYNETLENEGEKRTQLLKELFGSTGENVHVEPNIRVDYGYNIFVGENFSANFDCTILDVCEVRFGDNCMLAPGGAKIICKDTIFKWLFLLKAQQAGLFQVVNR